MYFRFENNKLCNISITKMQVITEEKKIQATFQYSNLGQENNKSNKIFQKVGENTAEVRNITI